MFSLCGTRVHLMAAMFLFYNPAALLLKSQTTMVNRVAVLAPFMIIVWFSSHAHLDRRVKRQRNVHADLVGLDRREARQAERRLRLPEASWFKQRLACHGVECSWGAQRLHHDAATQTRLSGLVKLRPALPWQGPLTNWGSEADLLWNYSERPLNSYSADIMDVAFLVEPLEVFALTINETVFRPSVGSTFMPSVTTDLLSGMFCSGPGGGGRRSVREIVESWGVEWGADVVNIPCISLPQPVADLMGRGAWHTLLLLARVPGWLHVDPLLPAGFLTQVRAPGFDEPEDGIALTTEFLTESIAFLRQWAPAIIRDDPDAQGALEGLVRVLGTTADALSPSFAMGQAGSHHIT